MPVKYVLVLSLIKKVYLHLHNLDIWPLNPTSEVTGVCKFKVLPYM